MFESLLFLCVSFLAFANGAKDNFKGVAGLYGRGMPGYLSTLVWAAITALVGSALFLPPQSIILSLTPNQS